MSIGFLSMTNRLIGFLDQDVYGIKKSGIELVTINVLPSNIGTQCVQTAMKPLVLLHALLA